jgi:hypothetical protein
MPVTATGWTGQQGTRWTRWRIRHLQGRIACHPCGRQSNLGETMIGCLRATPQSEATWAGRRDWGERDVWRLCARRKCGRVGGGGEIRPIISVGKNWSGGHNDIVRGLHAGGYEGQRSTLPTCRPRPLSVSISGNAPPSAGSRWRRFPDFRAVCEWRMTPHSSTSEIRSLTWSKFSMTQPGSES